MQLLLDSHVLLWWLNDQPLIKEEAYLQIASADNTKYISTASIWELEIKASNGRLKLPEDFKKVLKAQPVLKLPVTSEHAHAIRDLPHHHKDPFDRMLIVQCQIEGLTIITRDPVFKSYGLKVIEA